MEFKTGPISYVNIPTSTLPYLETHKRLQYAIDDPAAFVQRIKSCLLALDTLYDSDADPVLSDFAYFLASKVPKQISIEEHCRVMDVVEHEELLHTYLYCVLTRRAWMEGDEEFEFKNIQVKSWILWSCSDTYPINII